jgi:hypothetical protein
MQVEAIQCKHCKTVLFARASSEWRCCSCGQTSIAAEEDYIRVSRSGFESSSSDSFVLDLGDDVSPQLLAEDKNNNWDEWGRLPCSKILTSNGFYEFLEGGEIVEVNKVLQLSNSPIIPKPAPRRKKP